MRTKNAAYNSVSSLLLNIVTIIAGFILPRLILSRFGSDYYGAVGTISQFIGFIGLLTAGVGGVTIAALFKPLAEQDTQKISGIMRATESFMRKVALIFAGVLIIIAALYPLLITEEFDWFFVFSLTLILGSRTFVHHYFGITYILLLSANQRIYVLTLVQVGTVILNTAVAALLILAGFDIRIVYLASAVLFAINPIFIYIYARKRYNIDYSVSPDNIALKQRWDAFAHQVADFANANAPIFMITIFIGILDVSVFVVYSLVIFAVRSFIVDLAGSGMSAGFGDMLAKKEDKKLQDGLRLYEFTIHTSATLLLACTAILIVPFVSVFTLGVDDVDYYRPIFALLFCVAEFFNISRVPYQTIANVAGHFRQTRNPAFIEIGISVTISIVLVQWFGIIGVIIGLLCGLIFRTVVFAIYVSRHLIVRSIWLFVRRVSVSLLIATVIFLVSQFLPYMTDVTYWAWILFALPVFGVAIVITALFSMIFYREEIRMLISIIRHTIRG
ncbi:MAG: sugar isomerase [Oscillospiraceae bacterium]|nr:sugar isomerase [Oscillospiraceae bacterium]MCL2279534.1 sugar isomerase [Oscillospiraceae bacterium]